MNLIKRVVARTENVLKQLDSIFHMTRNIDARVLRICDMLPERTRALGVITILANRCLREDETKLQRTVLGTEFYIYPGQTHVVGLDAQCEIQDLFWFVTGHPGLVVNEFKIGQYTQLMSYGGVKYGECDGPVRVGNKICVTVTLNGDV